jgi:hypothetical protein
MTTYKINQYLLKGCILLLLVCFLLISCSTNDRKNNTVLVGSSFGAINPDTGSFIAGDKQNRHFKGIHDSLYVKVVLVSDSKNSFAILTVDCIGIIYPTLLEIRKAVSEQIPASEFDPSHIVLSSTHTHSGPDVVGLWGANQASSGVNDAYMKKLVTIAASKIAEAWKSRKPGHISWAETKLGEGWVYNICIPEELDGSVTILQFTDMKGNSIATLTNFACHPTFMDAATDLVSADYVGGFYKEMNNEIHGVNLFLQGAVGGWVQPEYEKKNFDNAFSKGKLLANMVLSSLKNSRIMDMVDIQFMSKVFGMPVSNQGFKQLSALGVIRRTITDSVQTEIAWFGLGSAQFVTHPGETSPSYSFDSKKLMKTNGPKFVLGLGMDGLGYIIKPDFFDPSKKIPHADYLTGMSIDKNAGIVMMNVIENLSSEK